MCRSIKPLFNFEPPATEDEVEAAALQFVRKISGFRTPSQNNRVAFDQAVAEITRVSMALLQQLETRAPVRTREEMAAKAKARYQERG